MLRLKSIAILLPALWVSSALAAPDAVLLGPGDIRIKGAGSGLVFPDGSIQYKATAVGPAGPAGAPGPPGPAGSVTFQSLCAAIRSEQVVLPSFCRTVDHVVITPASASVLQGKTLQLTASAYDTNNELLPSDNTQYDWKPSGSVSPEGLVTATTAGDITITASYKIPRMPSGSVTVNVRSLATTTVAGRDTFETAGGYKDDVGTAARFYDPNGITTDGTYLYVADSYNRLIRKVHLVSKAVTTVAGRVGYAGGSDGIGTAATFSFPTGIAHYGNSLYVADQMNHTIRKIDLTSGAVSTLAGMAQVPGNTDGVGSAARFSMPSSMTTDGTYLYVLDHEAVRRISLPAGQVSTISSSTGSGVVFLNGNLFITDSNRSVIKRLDLSSSTTDIIAGADGYAGSYDGLASEARFVGPRGITVCDGSLYVVDSSNTTVRKVSPSTGLVETVAGTPGQAGTSNGVGTAALFMNPIDITCDGSSLYVTDTSTDNIRMIPVR